MRNISTVNTDDGGKIGKLILISTVDHIFSIRQILDKKWECNKEICQVFIDFEKAYDSIKRESLYDILIKFDVPKKLD